MKEFSFSDLYSSTLFSFIFLDLQKPTGRTLKNKKKTFIKNKKEILFISISSFCTFISINRMFYVLVLSQEEQKQKKLDVRELNLEKSGIVNFYILITI